MSVKIFPIIMSDKDSLQTFVIEKDTEFKIELSEPCSAGYMWSGPVFDDTVLSLKTDERPNDGKPFDIKTCAVGSVGKRRFVFQTQKIGASVILTSLKRSFDPKNTLPAETFSVSIHVV